MKSTPILNAVIGLLGSLLILSPVVNAQSPEASSVTIDHIIVSAEGYASAPADGALIFITIGKEASYIEIAKDYVPGLTPDTSPADPAPILKALTSSGVPAEDITQLQPVFSGEWGPGITIPPTQLVVRLDAPTVPFISELLDATITAARENTLFINSFAVMYTVNDCQALRAEARANAVANARENAEAQATAMDVTLGDIVGSRDLAPTSMTSWQPSNCAAGFDGDMTELPIYSIAVFDPNKPAEVVERVGLEVMFETP